MSFAKLLLALSVTTLLLGCASLTGEHSTPENDLLGENIEQLYQQWGQPTHRAETSGSQRILYIWDLEGCMSNVTTDAEGTIIGYAASGDCHFMAAP